VLALLSIQSWERNSVDTDYCQSFGLLRDLHLADHCDKSNTTGTDSRSDSLAEYFEVFDFAATDSYYSIPAKSVTFCNWNVSKGSVNKVSQRGHLRKSYNMDNCTDNLRCNCTAMIFVRSRLAVDQLTRCSTLLSFICGHVWKWNQCV